MRTLNLYAAKTMEYFESQIKASTDVTGFGIKGHSDNLVEMQNNDVDFVIEKMPVYGYMHKLDKIVRDFKLKEGFAAETSGGLFIVMSEKIADEFQEKLKLEHGIESWNIGYVAKGSKKTVIKEDLEFIEVY